MMAIANFGDWFVNSVVPASEAITENATTEAEAQDFVALLAASYIAPIEPKAEPGVEPTASFEELKRSDTALVGREVMSLADAFSLPAVLLKMDDAPRAIVTDAVEVQAQAVPAESFSVASPRAGAVVTRPENQSDNRGETEISGQGEPLLIFRGATPLRTDAFFPSVRDVSPLVRSVGEQGRQAVPEAIPQPFPNPNVPRVTDLQVGAQAGKVVSQEASEVAANFNSPRGARTNHKDSSSNVVRTSAAPASEPLPQSPPTIQSFPAAQTTQAGQLMQNDSFALAASTPDVATLPVSVAAEKHEAVAFVPARDIADTPQFSAAPPHFPQIMVEEVITTPSTVGTAIPLVGASEEAESAPKIFTNELRSEEYPATSRVHREPAQPAAAAPPEASSMSEKTSFSLPQTTGLPAVLQRAAATVRTLVIMPASMARPVIQPASEQAMTQAMTFEALPVNQSMEAPDIIATATREAAPITQTGVDENVVPTDQSRPAYKEIETINTPEASVASAVAVDGLENEFAGKTQEKAAQAGLVWARPVNPKASPETAVPVVMNLGTPAERFSPTIQTTSVLRDFVPAADQPTLPPGNKPQNKTEIASMPSSNTEALSREAMRPIPLTGQADEAAVMLPEREGVLTDNLAGEKMTTPALVSTAPHGTERAETVLRSAVPSPVEQTLRPLIEAAQHTTAGSKTSLRLSLNPVELGQIEVQITRTADGHVSASLTAEQAETAQTLTQNIGHLREHLERAGIVVDQLNVTTATPLQAQTAQHFNQQSGQQQNASDHYQGTNLFPADPSGADDTAQASDDKLLSVHA